MGVTTDLNDVRTISKTANGSPGYDPSVVDVEDFFDRILEGYEDGSADG